MQQIKSVSRRAQGAPVSRCRKPLFQALSLACALGVTSAASAADYDWTGGGTDTNYSTPANWGVETGYPGSEDGARFLAGAAGKTVTFDGEYTPSYVWTATGNTASPVTWEGSGSVATTWNIGCADNVDQVGALIINSGTYNAGGGFNFGSGTGVLTMNGGTVKAGGMSYWGTEANANFTATIKSGATVNFNGIDGYTSLRMMNGTGITGTVNIEGGTFAVNGGDFQIGVDADNKSSTTINIKDGGVVSCGDATERWFIMGASGTGTITVNVNDGGTLSVWHIDHPSASESQLNIDGGKLKVLGDGWTHTLFSTDNDSSFTVTVGTKGATLEVPTGVTATISKVIKGENNTLTITGGGSVKFTAQPECNIATDGEATYTVEIPADGNFYWTGSGDGVNWSDTGNWSKGAVPGAEDAVVFNTAATVTLVDTTVKGITLNANVTFNGAKTLSLGADGISGNGTLTLAGAVLQSKTTATISCAIIMADGSTNGFRVGADSANLTISGKVTSQTAGNSTLEITQGTGRNNANAGVRLTGDWSDFAGNIVYFLSRGSINGAWYYQQRAIDTFTASATSAKARWDVYATVYDVDLNRKDGNFFTESGTAETPVVYKFGALKMRLPSTKDDVGYSSNVMLEVGNLDEDSYLLYSWKGARNCGVKWIAPTATFGSYAANTAYVNVTGGGNVDFSDAGIPGSINFAEKGGCIVLTEDASHNAAVLAKVGTIDLDDDGILGFCYDGEGVAEVDLSTKANDFAGKKIVKRGSGAVRIVGLPGGNDLCDVTVEAGTLVLPYGAAADAVDCTAEGAKLQIDVQGALDGAVVFSCTSIDGELEYLNKSSAANIVGSTTEAGTVWTLSFAAEGKTFVWNGSYDGAAWGEASNWLVDGAATEDVPSVIDTALFTSDAVVSASGTIAAGVVKLADGVTLTIPTGLTFNSLDLGENAKIAFTFDTIGNVGGTVDFITVASGVVPDSSSFVVPDQGNYSSSWQDGRTLTVKREIAIYIWADAKEDHNWATPGNWKVGEVEVVEVPAQEDSVEFPASNTEGFAWEVNLPWDVYADTVTLNADVILSGAKTLRAHTITGGAELKLNNAHIGSNGAALDVYCPLNAMPDTTNYIYLQKYGGNAGEAYIVNIHGPLYGSGELRADHAGIQGVGVKFHGDNSNFWGTFTSSNYNSRDCTDMDNYTSSSSHAVWNVYTYNNNSDEAFIVHGTDTYYFGALNGGLQMGSAGGSKSPNETVSIEVGARDDMASSFALASHVNYNKGYDVRKVGNNTMTITGKGWAGGNNVFRLNSLTIAGGTADISSLPNAFIKFEGDGGILRVGTDSATELPYDPSALIKNSTAPVGFDTEGIDQTWETAIAGSNVGGFIKDGNGVLTLAENPENKGVIWVKAGTLVIQSGMWVLDPRSLGTLSYPGEGNPVESYAYSANAVLDGTETADNALALPLDVTNLVKIDLSANNEAIIADLKNYRKLVLARTSSTDEITGLDHNIDLVPPTKPDDVEDKNWQWTVKVITEVVNGETWQVLCVVPKTSAFLIKLR